MYKVRKHKGPKNQNSWRNQIEPPIVLVSSRLATRFTTASPLSPPLSENTLTLYPNPLLTVQHDSLSLPKNSKLYS